MIQKIKGISLIVFAFLFKVEAYAQCAMCNATAESSIDSGSTAAKGLNNGVLYLLVMPILFAGILYYLYRRNR